MQLHVSGVLAVVTTGVLIKGIGINAFVNLERHHHFVELFGTWANDLIFILSGVFMGQFIMVA